MARLAEPGQVAGTTADVGLTFADVPAHLRPSSRYFLNRLPKTPDLDDPEHTIAAFGLGPDEAQREPVDRLRGAFPHWRSMIASDHRQRAYMEWLADAGLLDFDPRAEVAAEDADIRNRLGDLAAELSPSRISPGRIPREWSLPEFSWWDRERRRTA